MKKSDREKVGDARGEKFEVKVPASKWWEMGLARRCIEQYGFGGGKAGLSGRIKNFGKTKKIKNGKKNGVS